MERELTLATLTLAVCGPALLVSGSLIPDSWSTGSGRSLERSLGRRLWWPAVPPLLLFALLLGWASQEPDSADEGIGPIVAVLAPVFAAVWCRALVRAIVSLVPGRRQRCAARTVGLLRPRVVIGPELMLRLDSAELQAVLAHERAHARHRDPLRILLAQLVTDLQWPLARPRARHASWREALEISRDEEARAAGVDGPDLAAAILEAASSLVVRHGATAALVDEGRLARRIARLLTPMAPLEELPPGRWLLALLAVSMVAAVGLGHVFGEPAVMVVAGL